MVLTHRHLLILIVQVCFVGLGLFPVLQAQAQYYYKDQLSPRQTMQQQRQYRQQKIRSVTLTSFERDGQPSPDFIGEQSINTNYSEVATVIKSPVTGESELKTFYNAKGQLIKTLDTTDGSGSTSEYTYTDAGLLARIVNRSTSAGLAREKEEHVWFYQANGKPEKMYRIKNEGDTTEVTFVLDELGNVAEENSRRGANILPSYFYYYDAENRLTDIAVYNKKAKRLLPIYVFEYNSQGQIASMLVVPEGSDEYQKWYYEYDDGLKIKESAFNKRKQLLGRIQYKYN